MLKALLKKELAEMLSGFAGKRGGTRKAGGSAQRTSLLTLLLVMGLIAFSMGSMAIGICGPLHAFGLDRIYYAAFLLAAALLGLLMEIRVTRGALYQARDNDTLLSMPIPPRLILLSRIAGVSLLGLTVQLPVMAPAIVVHAVKTGFSVTELLLTLGTAAALCVITLVIACLVGWVIAWTASHFTEQVNKALTMVFSLLFLGAYFLFIFNSGDAIDAMEEDPAAVLGMLGAWFEPFALMGRACAGSVRTFLVIAAVALASGAVTMLILSRTFIAVATGRRGARKTVYRETRAVRRTADGALLQKEFRHLLASPMWMLNAGIGAVLMLGAAAALFVKGAAIRPFLSMIDARWTAAGAAAAVCLLGATVMFTASAISLEGRSLGLTRALPVTSRQFLRAKVRMQLCVSLPAVTVLLAAVLFVLRPDAAAAVGICLCGLLFAGFSALAGLAMNLWKPKLDGSSEMVIVKQSASVAFTMLTGMLGALLPLGFTWLVPETAPAALVCAAVYLALDAALYRLLRTWGCRRLEEL